MSEKTEENLLFDSKVHKRIGELIEALLKDESIGSSRQLGRITGIAFNTLVNWSEGKADPRLEKLMQFAYGIGWSMTELMRYAEGDEDPHEAIARKKAQQQEKAK
ncbi:transcriptional regulator [Aerosakkonema funiforme]|uniref:Transcriptional regulator n=1 Tax=Aerosakkonema funiforme FACHB-1375 TaxID=2949571 RepID=A0A926ZIF4_9CYAN|nr:transcriptional regulator [Aerosakkonema funiforme]MBD2183217.1 transcriptional regulator [Aerosakkonema funiforme FACHB-1375]